MVEHRYGKKDLESISELWADELKEALNNIPEEWMEIAFNKLPVPNESNL